MSQCTDCRYLVKPEADTGYCYMFAERQEGCRMNDKPTTANVGTSGHMDFGIGTALAAKVRFLVLLLAVVDNPLPAHELTKLYVEPLPKIGNGKRKRNPERWR